MCLYVYVCEFEGTVCTYEFKCMNFLVCVTYTFVYMSLYVCQRCQGEWVASSEMIESISWQAQSHLAWASTSSLVQSKLLPFTVMLVQQSQPYFHYPSVLLTIFPGMRFMFLNWFVVTKVLCIWTLVGHTVVLIGGKLQFLGACPGSLISFISLGATSYDT